jgi:cytoskeletal protein CcmA (bactofilin family)
LPVSPPRPGATPTAGLQAPPRPATPASDPGERRTLVVGRGISLHGTINDAERLVVEGTVEATMIRAAELSVIHGGVFKGEIEVEEAEIAGTIDGVITARTSLIVRASGSVLGRARCRRLQVEDGGQLTGQIEMLTDTPAAAAAAAPAAPAPVSDLAQPEVPVGASSYTG